MQILADLFIHTDKRQSAVIWPDELCKSSRISSTQTKGNLPSFGPTSAEGQCGTHSAAGEHETSTTGVTGHL